ncbi:xylose isomerase [Arthrobacter sp. MYb227]|uniref:sugar phosphate isomerase/epimerase family protein n=1 Tax=Arthrobacter sp. MYb227 TaxID=1848601 RepID=UPI000CFC91F5|nr:TIM barrel protein [Arthrobacter sp. MYb227]PQZ94857.1 xylose isomerase [Arthrobacter sp. MYb227]
MKTTTRQLGLAQLSLVATAPADLVRLAANAGFDFIGARVRPVTATERPYDLQPGSQMLAQTLAAVNETGVRIKDIEFLLLDGSDQRDAWLRMMQAGGALGASSLTIAAAAMEESRLVELIGTMTEDSSGFGLVPTLEVISYQGVNSLDQAARIANATGCKIVADTLHLSRVGTTDTELVTHAGLIPMLQLCDGPAQRPADLEGLVFESRSARMVPGTGGFGLAAMVAALPKDLPISVETPNDEMLAQVGEQAWAHMLKAGLEKVLAQAELLHAAPTLSV